MQLAECLARCPADQISRMARSAGLDPAAPRRTVEEHLVQMLTDVGRLSALSESLGTEEWQALKVVFWGGAGGGVTVELCHQVVNHMTGRRRQGAAQALARLMDQGLIFTQRQGYRQVYFIPPELLPGLSLVLERRMAGQVILTPAEEAGLQPEPALRDLCEEVHRFLAYIFKTEVPLTQQGLIYRRQQRTLIDLLGAGALRDEDDPVPGRYPEPLGFVAGFCLDNHLALRDEGVLRTGPQLDAWLALPQAEAQRMLHRYWEERYTYPDLQAFLHLAGRLGSCWIRISAAAAELEPLLHPGQRVFLKPRLEHHLTQFLAPLGAFAVATLADDLVCRLTDTGRWLLATRTAAETGETTQAPADISSATATYGFILQPSGEIIAPRPLPLPVLWRLELIGNLQQRGPALVYRVDRDSVYQSLRAGLSAAEVLAFLERHSQTGLPQNLAFDIQSWGTAFGNVHFLEACLLCVSDPLLARQIKAGRRTARFIRGELNPTALIIDRQDYDLLFQALVADGLMPRPGIVQAGVAAAEGERARAGGASASADADDTGETPVACDEAV